MLSYPLFLFCLSFSFRIRSINYISSSQIQTKPAPWMARAYNQVGRAREARLQNICLTCKRELARFLRQLSSRNRDKRVCQVEAVVRRKFLFNFLINLYDFRIIFFIIEFNIVTMSWINIFIATQEIYTTIIWT